MKCDFHSVHNYINEGGTLIFNSLILMVGPTNGCEAITNYGNECVVPENNQKHNLIKYQLLSRLRN